MTEKPIDVWLASRSPRRRELLAQIGVRYRLVDAEVDESIRADEPPIGYARRLAVDKARAGLDARGSADAVPVLGADTVVVLGDNVLGKPADAADAAAMLARLSNRTHEVVSGVALAGTGRTASRVSVSRVTFRALRDEEIAAYCATGEPLDKAGAYAVQGLAAAFVTGIEGSYSGVVGLPLFETASLLHEFGIDVLRRDGA